MRRRSEVHPRRKGTIANRVQPRTYRPACARPHLCDPPPPHTLSLSVSVSLWVSVARAPCAAYTQLCDMRNCYIKARLLFAKNQKRLADPRGDGEGGDRGVMSMF
eukprot:4601776-Pleurochrysis_carterae.AAC.4